MSSKTEIVNMALGHLATGKEVANIETENSEEARVARRFYDTALGQTVGDAPWPFLTKIAALGLIEEEPNTEWGYSYQYPSDCARMRRILSGIRNDNRQSRVPYKIAWGTSGKIIFTDEVDAELEYTLLATDESLFDEAFILAFSYYLAVMMAPTLTAGDQFKLGNRAAELYTFTIGKARSAAFDEQQDEEEPEAEAIRSR